MNETYRNKNFNVTLPLSLPDYHSSMSTSLVRWLANIPVFYFWGFIFLLILLPVTTYASNAHQEVNPWAVLLKWTPVLLTKGFLMNVVISFLTMALGTVMGVFLGLGQISLNIVVRKASGVVTQIFRNSPWLVLLFLHHIEYTLIDLFHFVQIQWDIWYIFLGC